MEKEISKKDKVALWSIFIMNPERIGEKEMSENSFIKKAKEELTKIQQNYSDKQIASVLEHIKKELNCLV